MMSKCIIEGYGERERERKQRKYIMEELEQFRNVNREKIRNDPPLLSDGRHFIPPLITFSLSPSLLCLFNCHYIPSSHSLAH